MPTHHTSPDTNSVPSRLKHSQLTPSFSSGEQPGEYKDFLFEPNVQQFQNGSLNFLHISKENEGQYLCEAKNNIGAGVSKVIYLKVNGESPK